MLIVIIKSKLATPVFLSIFEQSMYFDAVMLNLSKIRERRHVHKWTKK